MQKPITRATALIAVVVLLGAFAPAALAAESYTGTVNKDKVFFRSRADTDSVYYAVLNKGTKVTILGVRGDFYKVEYNRQSGYIMRSLVNASSAAKRAFAKAEQTAAASRYAQAKTISELGSRPGACSKGSYGRDVEKLQRALQIKGYLSGALDGRYGDQTAGAVEKFQKAAGLKVTGRADSATIRKLFNQEKEEVSAKNDPGMKGISSIRDITVPNTTRPGNSGRHVKALQQALKLKGYYRETIDSSYGKTTTEAVKRFQRSRGLKQDGIAGYSTIKALFGKDAANYTIPTEQLKWFDGGSSTIPKGATFQIKDVSTGMTFTARRWSGYNHLDAEPLSSGDAETLKKISGGAYSWRRRAILVMYNGHVYAASMNTMPHGEDTIPGNGFDGHFCIHFYKSKTHETNRVDGDHQRAVSQAKNASW
ncbi:MAG: peptidoglycan-binding protein [Christensenellales bacterium]|jgi:peptidoglycan hydrolase-like protein with peptidoglycan-binding domain